MPDYCVCRCGSWAMTRYTRPDDTESILLENARYTERLAPDSPKGGG